MQFKTNIEKLRDNKINFSFNLCITKENQHLKKEMMDYYRTYNPCAISCSYIFDEEFDFSVLYPKKIKPANFLHNLKHNPCIHGKITIYENGNIGTCPLMRNNIIGNIRKDRIYDILGDKKHCLYWDFTMENIVPCKECSSRYYCIDCRAIESTQTGNLYGKKYCPNKKILQAK
jgi:sulfatase maturation enzyme AslB (radical SAM superfamily)